MHLSRLLLCAAALCSSPAGAGSLRVDPVQIVIDDDRKTAVVTVVNEAPVATTLRVTPFEWSQMGGEDVYTRTDTIIASPPIVEVPSGARQIIRVGFRRPSEARRGSYRVVLEEMPRTDVTGVQVTLRLNLPLFARIEQGAASEVSWSAARDETGEWIVTGNWSKLRRQLPSRRHSPPRQSAVACRTDATCSRSGSLAPHRPRGG
jgi:fimbrial chaperone protein